MIDDLRSFLSATKFSKSNDDLLQRRSDAIKKFSQEKTDMSRYLNLIKFIYSLGEENVLSEEFRQTVIEFEPEFPKRGKIFDLKILSFVTLNNLIQTKHSSIGTPIALALVNCYGFGLRDKFPKLGIEEISDKLIEKQIIDVRNFNAIKTDFFLDNLIVELDNITVENLPPNGDELIKILPDLFERFKENIKIFEKTLNDRFSNVNRKEAILKDDSNILWWFFSKNSKTLQKPWNKIKATEAYLLIGKELADQINLPPGPSSYDQIMKSIIEDLIKDSSKNVTLNNVIMGLTEELKKDIINSLEIYIDEVTPVHYLIMQSLEKKTGDNFVRVAKKAKINIMYPLPPINFAIQMYRERMYIKSIRNLGV